jgi:hypothetical protein
MKNNFPFLYYSIFGGDRGSKSHGLKVTMVTTNPQEMAALIPNLIINRE